MLECNLYFLENDQHTYTNTYLIKTLLFFFLHLSHTHVSFGIVSSVKPKHFKWYHKIEQLESHIIIGVS